MKKYEENNYTISESSNFLAFFFSHIYYRISNDYDKLFVEYGPLKIKITDENGNKKEIEVPNVPASYDMTLTNDEGEGFTERDTIEDKHDKEFEEKLKAFSKLPLMVLRFYDVKKGKKANKTKYFYYCIFTTGLMAELIQTYGTELFNRQEAVQVINGDYIRFIAFTDYEKLEDILIMKIKTYKDIGVPDCEGEDVENKKIKLSYDPRAIREYRFRTGLDKERMKQISKISEQHTEYEETLSILRPGNDEII